MAKQPEILLQDAIIDRVKYEKGHAFKLSNKFLTGIPDLLIRVRAFGTFISEVKFIPNVQPGRTYTIPIRDIQRAELRKWHAVDPGDPFSIALIGYKIGSIRYLSAVPPWIEEFEHGEYPTTGGTRNHDYHMSSLWWGYTEGYKTYVRPQRW